MPRPKLSAPKTERADLNHEVIAADVQAMDADGVRRHEIMERFGDGAPYDRMRVMDRVRFLGRRAADDVLELGKSFVFMKENEEHGDFLQLITELGYAPRTVQNLMRATVKFLAPARDNPKLLALQPSKLIELAVLDDEDVKELAKGKTVAGIDLDEIDTLSTRELRARLREVRSQLEAKDKVIASKNKKLDEIDERNSHKAAYELQFERGLKDIGAAFEKLQLACAEIARLAESIPDMEFEGVEKQNDTLTLQAQLAVQFHARSELALEQGVGLFVAARSDYIDALLGVAKKKLPEDIKTKLFGG